MKTKKGCLKNILKEQTMIPIPVDLLFDIVKWSYNRLKDFSKWLGKKLAKWKNECYRMRGKENIECNLVLIEETRKRLEKERKNCVGKDCKKIDDFLNKLKTREDKLKLKLKAYKD